MKHLAIVIVLIISLVGAGLTRQLAFAVRGGPIVAAASSGRSLSGMNSYALALLLGGLRGPLVMFLWSTSESQKSLNDLEDFDSKVEWIRLLQPEFDSVHIFQIWNKAYNISVKMTSQANKYATILDALEYAHNVDAEKPNNINIVSAIGGIYFDKFGNSAEKFFYRKQVRTQTIARPGNASNLRNDPGVRKTELDPILDKNFNILPELITPRMSDPLVDPNNSANRYDGSELQFLPEFQPYPYGVSPFAIAYSYHRRAELLQLVGKQRHAQLSDLVIDSRPPLSLKLWADEETEYARRAELTAFGKTVAVNTDKLDLELNAASISLGTAVNDRPAIDEAIFEYDRSALLYGRADSEFAQHILRFKQAESTYDSQRSSVIAQQMLAWADRDYLKSMIAPQAERAALIKQSADEYARAANLSRVVLLKFSVWDSVANQLYPKGMTRQNVNEVSPQLTETTDKAVAEMEKVMGQAAFLEDSREYLQYIDRATTRLKLLQSPATSGQ